MRAVLPDVDPQDPVPRLGELPDPEPGPGEVLLRVHASGLNRVDLLQIRGRYPVPPGESEVPGLECSGVVETLGAAAAEGAPWRVGDAAMALLGGGGHAERVAVPVGQLMSLPHGWSHEQGASIPEAALTAWTNLVAEGRLQAGERVLISAATGGVGSFACQLARELGAGLVIGTGRSRERLEALRPLGIETMLVEDEALAERVRELTAGAGLDLVLDFVGGSGFPVRLELLSGGGRLLLLGLMGGGRCTIDLEPILRRRLLVLGSQLRSRSRDEKAELVRSFDAFSLARFVDGRLRPVLARTYPAERIAEAYDALLRGEEVGKIVVRWDG